MSINYQSFSIEYYENYDSPLTVDKKYSFTILFTVLEVIGLFVNSFIPIYMHLFLIYVV